MDRPLRIRLEHLEARVTPAFTALPPFNVNTPQPAVVASADLNGDGFADAIVGNATSGVEQPNVDIALGAGDGSFTAFQTLIEPGAITTPRSITVRDLNGDGHFDLVVSSFNSNTLVGSLLVYTGQADGSFKAAPIVVSAAPSLASAVGEFTGDGILDIVSLVPDTVNTVGGYEIYSGSANGFNLATAQTPFPFDVNRVVVGDFDNDTNMDFIAIGSTDQLLFAFYGNGKAQFTVPAPGFATIPFTGVVDVAIGDFDGDNLLDFALSSNSGVTFHRNLGARQFDLVGVNLLTISGSPPPRLAAADLDLNSVADIVASGQTDVRVFYGSFGKGFTEDPSNPLAITGTTVRTDAAIGDANGDGKPDLIVVRLDNMSLTGSDGRVFLNMAPVPTINQLVLSPSPGIAGTPTELRSDILFNGNPFPFGVMPGGTVAFEVNGQFFGNGNVVNGVATLPANLPAGTHTVLARYLGDTRFEPSVSDPITITIVGAGGTTYQFEVTGLPTLPGLGSDRVASGSFTGDLVRDIAIASGPGRTASLELIDGKSRTQFAETAPFGDGFTGGLMVAAGDIDGDGIDDVAVAADIGGGPRVSIYLVKNGTLALTNNFFALDENFRGGLRIALADMDDDGLAELIVVGGPGAGPRVATYDGRTLADFHTPERLFEDFFAMDPDSRLGMFVAAGDLDGDGTPEIAVSSDAGGGPRILIFDGESLLHDDPERVADFFAGNPDARGGLRIAIRDVSPSVEGFGLELIAGDGPGAGSTVRVYSGNATVTVPSPIPLVSTELLPGYLGGVFVA